jgi:thiosulfate/3-mercaptopyruvate sulfurtransferase
MRFPRGWLVRRAASAPLAILVLATACVWAAPAAGQWPWEKSEPDPEPVYPDVTVSVSRLAEGLSARDVVALDARPRGAYLLGHIPDAVSAPVWSLPEPPALAEALGKLGLSGAERVVCYGDSLDSENAARLFWLLESAGAADVAVLEGGMEAWVREAGEIETDERAPRAAEWKREANTSRVATRDYVRDAYGEKGFELVDARGWDVWEGEPQEPGVTPQARTGHIPHALPYDFDEFVTSDGALRSPEDTRATFSRLGPRPSNPVDLQDEFIVYGRGGPSDGAVGYYLLRRAGIARVRYYPGGFGEWSSRPELPVTRVIHAEEVLARLNRELRLLVPDTPPRSFILLDVRHDRDYGIGHIPGAVNLQSNAFADSLDAALARHWPAVDRASTPIVSYCYGPSCIRSRNCSTMAARAGFLNTERFYGGIEEWVGIGAPVIRTLRE